MPPILESSARRDSRDLADCRSFVSADATTTWLVGTKLGAPPKLVARLGSGGPERELFSSGGEAFEDLQSEHLGEQGFAVSARYGGRVVLLRLKPDLQLSEARSYGSNFGSSPQLLSSGSGAMLLTSRRTFGRQRRVWAQFDDGRGRLPADFSGSDHGLPAVSPRLATAGSQRFLTLITDSVPRRLELVPVGATFDAEGRSQFVTAPTLDVVEAVPVGFDAGRVVVVYLTDSGQKRSELMARTLRCQVKK